MKKLLFLAFFSLLPCQVIGDEIPIRVSAARELDPHGPFVCVNIEDIRLCESGFHIKTEKGYCPLTSVLVDRQGLFMLRAEWINLYPDGVYECNNRRCKYVGVPRNGRCPRCNRPMS